jgi:hypothetical protein
MNPEHTYLFAQFANQALNPDDPNDPTAVEMRRIATENKLTVSFNKLGGDYGGACVMPPDNQVNVSLIKGMDNQWRVFI